MKTQYLILFYIGFSLFSYSQVVELNAFGPSNFTAITEISHANDTRLFVVEQGGLIKILTDDGSLLSSPFLDIDNLTGSGSERGLLGLAFAPDYTSSGRFYVNYTNNNGHTVVARYTVSSNPNIANTAGTILLTINQPFTNHNAGKMDFGPDGFLYIAAGDGGSSGDPGDRAQDYRTLLGKILRIDVSGSGYSIPTSNPYANSANGPNDPRPEIYALGLRNPWKFSFDKTSGDLWIADVGQNTYEEINRVSGSGIPGGNYGWRCYEGNNHNFDLSSGNCPSFLNTIAPVSEYNHMSGRCSITGGYIYRGSTYPNFSGRYFFADFCTGEIGVLNGGGNSWNMTLSQPNIIQSWTTFGEDFLGELYIAGGGNIYKLSDPNLSTPEFIPDEFKLFPNPTASQSNILLSSNFMPLESIIVYNLQGQKIKIIKPREESLIRFSIKNISKGLYLIEITAKDGKRAVKKLLIY